MVMPVSEEMVLNVIQDVDELREEKIEQEMERLSKNQPELLGFVLSATEDLDDDAKHLGIYLLFVIYKIFTTAYGRIRKATYKEIEESYEHNLSTLEQLEGAEENNIIEIAEREAERQPHILKYIAEALLMEDEEEDFYISQEDKGFLFIVLMTVINILDKKISKTVKA